MSSFQLIADFNNRSKVAAIGSTWSKVGDVLVERYNLAKTSSTFRRPPQSSREPYLKNELFDKTKLKNARFIKFIFLIFYFRRSHFVLKYCLDYSKKKKLNYVKLHYVTIAYSTRQLKKDPISGSSQK